MAASKPITRPLVSILSLDSDMETDGAASLPLLIVLRSAIHPDIVLFVHDNLFCNKRQPYTILRRADHQTSAESGRTGRTVSCIPCVPGGRTHRAGQGTFGNMYRGGRMLAPSKIWRKWHRQVNINQRRYTVVSALATSTVPSIVFAHGHHIKTIPELHLVLSDSAEYIEKTSSTIKLLKQIGAYPDIKKAKKFVTILPGKGKMRNRRYISHKGPLIVYGIEGSKIVRAFRNLPGVDVAHVDRLNILKLALCGHLGRFIIWTKSAFEKLDKVFGTFETPSEKKRGYVLPRPKMANTDLTRIINSDEAQSVVKPINKDVKRKILKKNPLKNIDTMLKLNPYVGTAKRMAFLVEKWRIKDKQEKLVKKWSPLTKVMLMLSDLAITLSPR